MKVKKYRAREISWTQSDGYSGYFEGSYFQMRKINYYDFDIDEEKERKNIGHYIVFCDSDDINMPNTPRIAEIDPATLEECGEWEVRE